MNLNAIPPKQFSFHLREKKQRTVSFTVSGDSINTSCNCGKAMPCEHALYIIAGRKGRISQSERGNQKELIQLLSKQEAGKALIVQAQKHFDHEMTCRVCESERVIDTKKSWLGPFYKLFMRGNLRYHCRRCGWNW